jgi:hypothetical protein
MARDWKNKIDDLANINMMIQSIAADPLPADPHAPVKVPKDQPGSSPWLPGKSPAPSRQQWVKNNSKGMTIAGGPYRMDKEGNAEVWKFGGPNYHYLPMPKSYYDLIESVRGMNFKKADAAAGTKIINELPRGGWPSRNSHRGLVDDDKLLDTMKRATAAFKA